MKEFLLNGEKYYIKKDITILDLLNYFNYENNLLVLEYNKSVCNEMYWKEIFIQDKDQIEIITIVGGG